MSSLIAEFIRPFRYYKYLLYQLTQREVKSRYKQSLIGYAWVLLNPLAQLMVYSFVFAQIFRFPTANIPYPVFLFAGLLPWTLFQTSILAATQSLVSNVSLIKKVSFPREVIPYSVLAAKLVDFCFSALVFLLFLIWYQVPLAGTFIWFFPVLAVQLLLTTGISLFLSAANLLYRDVQYLINLILMLWMYMTPIVYALSLVPAKYVWYYKLNPMVGIIEGYRAALFGTPFELSILWWSAGVSFVVFVIGYIIFKRLERVFADIA